MAKRSIKALQSKIDTENTKKDGGVSSTGIFYPHWKLPKDGITKTRFIEDPDQDNDLIFYTEFKEHVLNIGEGIERVPCLKNGNIKNPCPICELSKKYYDADDKKNGKYYYRDLYLLLRGIVTKDGLEYQETDTPATGMVKVFKFSYQLSTALKAALGQFEDGDEPWDLDNGFDFNIVKTINNTPNGEQAKYDSGSGFARRESVIDAEWRDDITDEPLSALIPSIPSYDEAVAILERHLRDLSGNLGTADDDGDAKSSELDLEAKINKQRERKAAIVEAEAEVEAKVDLKEQLAEIEDDATEDAATEDDATEDSGDIDIIKKLKS